MTASSGRLEWGFGTVPVAVVTILHLADDGFFGGPLLRLCLRIRTLTAGSSALE